MEDILLSAVLALFGVAAGFGIGAGNHKGLTGAIIPGVITGLVFSIPAFRDQQYLIAAITTIGAIAGSIACAFVPDTNGLKRFLRKQSNLVITCGSFKLGTKAKDDE